MEVQIAQNKRTLLIAIALLFVTYALVIELPYSDRSLSQMIIPAIRFENGVIFLSGIIPVASWIFAYRKIKESGYFKNNILIIIVLLFVIGPMISNVLEKARTPIYFMSDGVESIEIIDSKLELGGYNEVPSLQFNATVLSHKDIDETIDIYVTLPSVTNGMFQNTTYNVSSFEIMSEGRTYEIEYTVDMEMVDGKLLDDLFELDYHFDDYIVSIISNGKELKNIRNDAF